MVRLLLLCSDLIFAGMAISNMRRQVSGICLQCLVTIFWGLVCGFPLGKAVLQLGTNVTTGYGFYLYYSL
jgi:hypothetical protein